MHHRILGDALLVGGDCAGLVGRHRGHGHFLRPPDHRLGGGGVRVVAAAPTAPDSSSEPVVGATVKPGDHVAVRWQGEFLVAVIELIPRPFTPTVIVDGQAHTDDMLDTGLVEELLSVHCPDLEADIVSAGYRVGNTAAPDVVSLYQQVIGTDPAPANRRTWIVLRADPERTRKSAQRRDEGVAGLARYLVASATRIADRLASHGVDAVCGRSFDDYDHATDIGFVREKWSMIKGRDAYTAAYAAPGSRMYGGRRARTTPSPESGSRRGWPRSPRCC